MTTYGRHRQKVIDGVESDGMLASGAELGINKDHSGIFESTARPAIRSRLPAPTASSRSITSPSPTGPTCGDISAWRAKWRPSWGAS
jgi:hypothetical protein